MKAEEFVKTFTKEEILDALFHKSRLSERAARNLCVALFEEKSDRLLNEMEQSTSRQKPKSLREFMQQQEKFEKLDRQQEKLSKNFDSLEWYEVWQMDKIEAVRYLKELGKDATLEDGVVMLRSRATGAALDREYKAMKKGLKTAGYNGSLGIRGVRREAEA